MRKLRIMFLEQCCVMCTVNKTPGQTLNKQEKTTYRLAAFSMDIISMNIFSVR